MENMMTLYRYTLAAAAFAAFPLTGAFAQDSQAQDAPLAISPIQQTAQVLDRFGIRFRAEVVNEFAANPAGGVKQSETNTGQVNWGFDFDLNKMVGWPGAKIHTTMYRDYGDSDSLDNVGVGFKVQEVYKNPYNHFHFGLLTLEQKLFDDRVDIAVGRTATTAYFGHLRPACAFQNGLNCGIPVILNSESGFTLLPSATWGGKVSYDVTHDIYVQAGAFESNAFLQHTYGFDWSTKNATGYTLPFEAGWSTSPREAEYPFELKLGYVYNNAPHNDPYFNTAGHSLVLSGGKADIINARNTIYLLADKAVWRAGPKDPQVLTVFGQYAQPFTPAEVYAAQYSVGAVLAAPFSGRSSDTLGLVANYIPLTSREVDFLDDTRTKEGILGTHTNPNEFEFELNYGVALTKAIKVSPSVQYIVNPDTSAIPRARIPDNALVVGLKLSVNLGDLFGLPPTSPGEI